MFAENSNAVPQIIRHTKKCNFCMQIAQFKLKLFNCAVASGCLHVNLEEKRSFLLSLNF